MQWRYVVSQVFFLLGFYFYSYSVETPIFEKYSVGCYSVFFNYKKYSVLHYSVLLIFRKVLGYFLLGFGFLIKKYSVRVYSVMFLLGFDFLIKKYSVGAYSVMFQPYFRKVLGSILLGRGEFPKSTRFFLLGFDLFPKKYSVFSTRFYPFF